MTALSTTEDLVDSDLTQFVRATVDCSPADVPLVGGKAVGLGSLLRAGQRVPASFVVTAAAHTDYYAGGNPGAGRLRDEVRGVLESAYEQLCLQRQETVVAAVRSSATVEDSRDASCAGQFRTFLGARGVSEVVDQVEQCWVAAADPHVAAYRSSRNIDANDQGVAVVVQELVHARAAGVMFTAHPRTGDRSLVVIEASHGLGEAVVGGEVTPDLFEVNKVTRQVQDRRLGTKHLEHRLNATRSAVDVLPVDPVRQQEWAISDAEIGALVEMAAALETTLGRGLDVEWAIGTTGAGDSTPELFALQVRPITVESARAAVAAPGLSPIDLVLGRLSGHPTGPDG